MAKYTTGIESKEAILSAGKNIFYEKGFNDARFKQICDAAGANHGTFVYHYGGIDNLAYDVYSELYYKVTEICRTIHPFSKRSEALTTMYIVWWMLLEKDENIRRFVKELNTNGIAQRGSEQSLLQNFYLIEDEFHFHLKDDMKHFITMSIIGTESEFIVNYEQSIVFGIEKIVRYLMSIMLTPYSQSSSAINKLFNSCMNKVVDAEIDFDFFKYFMYPKELLPKDHTYPKNR